QLERGMYAGCDAIGEDFRRRYRSHHVHAHVHVENVLVPRQPFPLAQYGVESHQRGIRPTRVRVHHLLGDPKLVRVVGEQEDVGPKEPTHRIDRRLGKLPVGGARTDDYECYVAQGVTPLLIGLRYWMAFASNSGEIFRLFRPSIQSAQSNPHTRPSRKSTKVFLLYNTNAKSQ